MAAQPKPRIVPLGTAIDSLWSLREQKRALEADVKLVEENIHALEEQVMERLDAEGLEKSTGKAASVSISKTTASNIDDFAALEKYVLKTKQLHLFQRRLSEPAVREIMETKGMLPGVSSYTKRKLNLRSLA